MREKNLKLSVTIGGDVPTNGAEGTILQGAPYRVEISIRGTADLLFHRWNCEEVDAKSKAAKGSSERKTDNVENFVYRTINNELAIPGEYLRQSIIMASKYRQDPRSARKSAMDLYKAGVVSLTELASLGKDRWDYEDRRRVVIQRSGVNRTRPAFRTGWEATFILLVNTPEHIRKDDLLGVITDAGKLVGIGDFRPTYGRFQVTKYIDFQES